MKTANSRHVEKEYTSNNLITTRKIIEDPKNHHCFVKLN